jgi:hypothetical protein
VIFVMCDGNELNAASTRTSISVHASRGRKYCVEHGKYRRSGVAPAKEIEATTPISGGQHEQRKRTPTRLEGKRTTADWRKRQRMQYTIKGNLN